MLLITHILIAISGIIYTIYLVARPSRRGVKVSAGFIAGTLATGFGLVIVANAPMLSTCASGLAYTVLVSAGIALAQRRLQTQEITRRS